MGSERSYRGLHFSTILFQLIFLFITVSSFSQTKQSYRNHEEIDIGGGMKVEILKCTGDGPTEECDCIYFTDKRQNGTRMRQNANRIKEEERAALIAKSASNPQPRKSISSSPTPLVDKRADKVIPTSLTAKKVVVPNPGAALEDAVRQADSVAKARSQKMNEILATTTSPQDSTEMDKVYIPKVTETGETRLEISSPKMNVDSSAASAYTVATVEASAKETASPDSVVTSKLAYRTTARLQDTSVSITMPVDSIHAPTKTVSSEKETPKKTMDSAIVTSKSTRDSVGVSSPDSATLRESVDAAEQTWVKQYQNVKPIVDSSVNVIDKKSQKQAEAKPNLNEDHAKDASKSETQTTGSGVMSVPGLYGVSSKKKDGKIKTEKVEVLKTDSNRSKPVPYVNSSPEGKLEESTTGNTATLVDNNKAINVASPFPAKDTNYAIVQDVNISGPPQSSSTAPADQPSKDPVEKDGLSTNNTSLTVNGDPHAVIKTNSSAAKSFLGKTAEVNSKGEWEKVIIIDKESEYLYKVHYPGQSEEKDEWVPVIQIRNIDTASRSSKPAGIAKINANCSFDAPAPAVSNGDKFSEKLAKRKIYESYVAAGKGNKSIKTGVVFLSITAEDPYVNAVSISATNNLEVKLSFAPAGAMIYPVRTEYKVCEQMAGKTTSKTLDARYACFRNKMGSWTCANLE